MKLPAVFKKLPAENSLPLLVPGILLLWLLTLGATPMLGVFGVVYCFVSSVAYVRMRRNNNLFQHKVRDFARESDEARQKSVDRFSEYRSGFVDYAALKPHDPKQTADWMQGWNHAQLTWHNRRAAEQATAPPVPEWTLTDNEREALESSLLYVRGIISDIDLWKRNDPAAYVAHDDVYRMFEKVEKIFDPVAGLPAQLALARKLGLSFGLVRESNQPAARLAYIYREGSELAKLDERRMAAINEDIRRTAGTSPEARYAYLHIDAATLAEHVEYGLNIQVKLDDEGVVIDAFGKDSTEVATTWKMYQEMGVQVRDAQPEPPVNEMKFTIPVYNGAYYSQEVIAGTKPEWSLPSHPVLVRETDGLRIVLGSHDGEAAGTASVCLERHPHAWVIFLHPNSDADAVGYVYFFDDGKAAFYEERHYNGQSIEMLAPGSSHPLIDGDARVIPITTEVAKPAEEGPQL